MNDRGSLSSWVFYHLSGCFMLLYSHIETSLPLDNWDGMLLQHNGPGFRTKQNKCQNMSIGCAGCFAFRRLQSLNAPNTAFREVLVVASSGGCVPGDQL
jgi:hypothetical protein